MALKINKRFSLDKRLEGYTSDHYLDFNPFTMKEMQEFINLSQGIKTIEKAAKDDKQVNSEIMNKMVKILVGKYVGGKGLDTNENTINISTEDAEILILHFCLEISKQLAPQVANAENF